MKNLIKQLKVAVTALLIIVAFIASSVSSIKDNVKNRVIIDIGYQSVTAQTWGALIVKDQELFEKELEKIKPYYNFDVRWHDEVSGAPINNNMMAHKFQFGFLGDLPILINLENSAKSVKYNALLIAIDGRGKNGANQSILVSEQSGIKSIEDLKDKQISVPVGSSAYHMLMRILEKHALTSDVQIQHQDIPTAYTMVHSGKLSVVAAWEPYPSLFLKQAEMVKLVDGNESGVDYIAGIVEDKDWAIAHPEYTKAFLKSIRKAHRLLNSNKVKASKIISRQSRFKQNIVLSALKDITWNSVITSQDVDTFYQDYQFMRSTNSISKFPLDRYLKPNQL